MRSLKFLILLACVALSIAQNSTESSSEPSTTSSEPETSAEPETSSAPETSPEPESSSEPETSSESTTSSEPPTSRRPLVCIFLCPRIYRPVCARYNGYLRTYPNMCWLASAIGCARRANRQDAPKIQFLYAGRCGAPRRPLLPRRRFDGENVNVEF